MLTRFYRVIAGAHIQAASNVTDLLGGLNFGSGGSRTSTPAPGGAPVVVTMPNEPFDAVIAIGVLIKGTSRFLIRQPKLVPGFQINEC
jgi:6,7-dimethyl-8-ribityllumazine synthase